MAHMPSSLREPLKLLVQYLAVVFASIPGGIVYALCVTLNVHQSVALVVSVSIGILSSYLAWRALDKRILLPRPSFSSKPRGSLTVLRPQPATSLDELFVEISNNLGLDPEEVTTEYIYRWRELEFYPKARVELPPTSGGAFSFAGRKALTVEEVDAQRKGAKAFFRKLGIATS